MKERASIAKTDKGAITQVHKKQRQAWEKFVADSKTVASAVSMKKAQQKALRKSLQSASERVITSHQLHY